ncbi:MAG TPA: bifunctional folylpolyglutamate synthase/dihydrofolate synthase, partial [Nitrospiraceae bacterium]|nr:bifunctional folylpolyglutamate synthase/dihydrofolate synthase [Nitrospiraceae bacterium]
MGYAAAINYLYGLQKHGIKLGLDNTAKLLFLSGNPQNYFSSVHIAGTNGKGSTSAIIASILQTAGVRTGLFTSPHLVSFTERIRVNNEEIREDEVIELTEEIRSTIEGSELNPTFFEFVTVMGFLYFKRKNIDWAAVETGMGGRLDATNVLTPEVSVITNISYDHKDFLGNTISEIAEEKAGIIKKGVPVITSEQEPS